MPEDAQNRSDASDRAEFARSAKEDRETTAARRELKQTSISEKEDKAEQSSQEDDKSASSDDDASSARQATPDMGEAKNNELKDQVGSPKKKRAHDELDEVNKNDDNDGSASDEAPSRTDRSEPEKKRARDRQESAKASNDKAESSSTTITSPRRRSMEKTVFGSRTTAAAAAPSSPGTNGSMPTTSASAFANSGFSKLAASASPFGAVASSGKPSIFGAPLGSTSKPAGPAAPPAAPKLSFGSGAAAAPSPFSSLNGEGSGGASVFARPSGSTFGGGSLPGSRLFSFANPIVKDKAARPFGAPESDAEDGSDKGDEDDKKSDAGSDKDDKSSDENKEKEKETEKDSQESRAASEDKKKPKLQKIVVDDGEGDEATLLAVRAKMFLMEKGIGWKERGAGMLKVNVPKSSVERDEFGNADPNTFDASVLDEDDENGNKGAKIVRLIMRQDHTLRVILNTPVLPAMTFQLQQKTKGTYVLFTAFESGEAKQVQMGLNEANATAFTQLMEMIKKQLADV